MNSDDGIRLLCLDGGGIRGLSELIILKAIMDRVRKLLNTDEELLPADYFDMIGGTSTGGLIAIMLGRLRMTVDEAIEAYEQLSRTIFGTKRSRFYEGRYSEKTFETVIKSVVAAKTGDENAKMRQKEITSCLTFVCTVAARSIPRPRLFRSYQSPRINEYDCTIVEASRATCAAPTYFKGVEIGPTNRQEEFFDGGVGCNNPIKELHQEAEAMFDPESKVACIVSLGTGVRNPIEVKPQTGIINKIVPLPINVINGFKKMALSSEQYALDMERKYADISGLYFRLNVEHGLESIKLADYRELGLVQTRTLDYLQSPGISQQLQAIAKALIGQSKYHDQGHYTLAHLSMSTKTVIDAVHNTSAKSSIYISHLDSQPSISQSSDTLVRSWLSLETDSTTSADDDHSFYLAKRFLNPDTQFESCDWLFETQKWIDFTESSMKSILWLHGPPGCGKSVLTARIIDKLQAQPVESKTIMLYHYCRHDPQPTTSMEIFRSLLIQSLKIASTETLDYLWQLSDRKPNLRSEDQQAEQYLRRALQNIIENSEHKIYIVIDAIDELTSNASLLKKILSLLKSSQTTQPMRLVLCSRFNHKTVESLEQTTEIEYFQVEITDDIIQKDIREFITFRVNNEDSPLCRKTQRTRDDIINNVCRQAQTSFLYANLVLDELKGEKVSSPAAISNTLKYLPPKLYNIYEHHLDLPKRSTYGKEAFQWISGATRALTWDEIRCALAIEDGKVCEDNIIDCDCDAFVKDSCGELVEVFGDGRDKLRFIHATVKEMLDSEEGPGQALEIRNAHSVIALKLLSYLQNEDLPEFHLEIPFEMNRASVFEYIQEPGHAIYPYAVLNWFSHIAQCGTSLQEEVEQQLCEFLSSPACVTWLKGALFMSKWSDHTRDSTALTTDVAESLNKWIKVRTSADDLGASMFIRHWLSDFLGLMQDWGRVLEYSPFWIHCIPRQFLADESRFGEALQLQLLQKVVTLEEKPLLTRRSDATPWQPNCFSIDKKHDLAYTWDQASGQLSCYHRGTSLLAARISLDTDSEDLKGFELVMGTQCSQNRFMALLFRDISKSNQNSPIFQRIRSGLQPTMELYDDKPAWIIQNELCVPELHWLPISFGVSDVCLITFILELSHDGFMRTNLFGYPTWSVESVCSVDLQWVRWEVDDNNILMFSPDSRLLATPSRILRLDSGTTEIPIPLGHDHSVTSGVMVQDFSAVVAVRDSSLLQFLKFSADSSTPMIESEYRLSGAIHILSVSENGRFSLLLQVQKHSKSDKQRSSRRDKFLQDCCIGIFDRKSVKNQWVPLIKSAPPVSRKLSAWDFKDQHLFARFKSESKKVFETNKVVFLSPPGWQLSENIRRTPGVSIDQLSECKYLLAFESERLKDGFGSHPTLVYATPLSQLPSTMPKIEYADFVLNESPQQKQRPPSSSQKPINGTKSDSDSQRIQSTPSHQPVGNTISRDDSRAEQIDIRRVIVSPTLNDIYQIDLRQTQQLGVKQPRRDEATFAESDPHQSAYSMNVIHVQLNANLSKTYSLTSAATHVEDCSLESQSIIVNENALKIGTLTIDYLPGNISGEGWRDTGTSDLLSIMIESFRKICQPFKDGQTSSLVPKNDFSDYTIFSYDDIEVRGDIHSSPSTVSGTDKIGREFVLSDLTPVSDGRYVIQFASPIRMSKPFRANSEAVQYEVFLCMFDSNHGFISWFIHTTSAGEINDTNYVPKAKWALHPSQPLLFWTLPGHAIHMSRLDLSVNPINVCDSLMIEHEPSEAIRFSPNGKFVSLLTHSTYKMEIMTSELKKLMPKFLVVLDLVQGVSTVMELPAKLVLSADLDDDYLKIYQLTELGAVQLDSFPLDGLIGFQRDILTFLPDYCCCTSCNQPLTKSCHICVTEHVGVKTIILSHSPIPIGRAAATGKVCQPLLLTIASPEIPVQLSGTDDSLVTSQTTRRFPPVMLQSGDCSADAFSNRPSTTLKESLGPRTAQAFRSNEIAEVPQMETRVTDFTKFDGSKLEIGAVADFWRSDYQNSLEDLKFVDEFAKRLRDDEVLRKLHDKFGDDIFPSSWDEFEEINMAMKDSDDPFFKDYLDTMLKDSGLGHNIPIYTHTFCFRQPDSSNELDFTWTSAVDIGWIEEQTEVFMRRVIMNDFAHSRMFYAFTRYGKISEHSLFGLSNSERKQIDKDEEDTPSPTKGKPLLPLSYLDGAPEELIVEASKLGSSIRKCVKILNEMMPGAGKILEARFHQVFIRSVTGESMLTIDIE